MSDSDGAALPLPPCAGPVVDADGHVVEPESAWAGLPERSGPTITRRRRRLRARRGRRHRDPGRAARHPGPPGLDLRRPRLLPPAGRRPAGRVRPAAAPGRHGRRGHRPGRAVPDDRAVLLGRRRTRPPPWPSPAPTTTGWPAYCAADPRRLFGAAMLPLQDPAAAAARAAPGRHRARLRRRLRPAQPLPAAARSPTGPTTPCGRRPRSSTCRSASTRAARSSCRPSVSDRPFNPLILHAVSHSFEADAGLRAAHRLRRPRAPPGAPRRVPRVLGRLGARSGWSASTSRPSPSAASAPTCALRPSEYFARQCAISFEVDEQTLPALAPFVGAGRIVWGSDYPHHDATFPGAVDALRHTLAPCPTATQAKVLGLNARRIYRLRPRHDGAARDHRRLLRSRHGARRRPAAQPLRGGRQLRRRRRRAARARRDPGVLHRAHVHLRRLPPHAPAPSTSRAPR